MMPDKINSAKQAVDGIIAGGTCAIGTGQIFDVIQTGAATFAALAGGVYTSFTIYFLIKDRWFKKDAQ